MDLANSVGRAGDEGEWTPVSTDQEGEYFPPQMETTPALPAYHSLSEEIAFVSDFYPRMYHARIQTVHLAVSGPPSSSSSANSCDIYTWPIEDGNPKTVSSSFACLWTILFGSHKAGYLGNPWNQLGILHGECFYVAVDEPIKLESQIYWALWWYNLLLPALTLRIIFALLRRRIFPYPSLQDLREHRAEILAAEEFGDQVSARLSASSSGMTEIWRIVKIFDNSKKSKVKKFKEKLKSSESLSENLGTDGEEATVLDDPEDCEGDKDVKRAILHILDDIADMHERVRKYASLSLTFSLFL